MESGDWVDRDRTGQAQGTNRPEGAPATPAALDFAALSQKHTSRYQRDIRALLPGYDALFAVADAYLRPHVPDGGSVLVAGAGGGMELSTLGPAHPDWHFTAVDPAVHMLDLARAAAVQTGVIERVTFFAGDVGAAPQTAHDAATCILVLHFLDGDDAKHQLLKDLAHRLRPGAPLVTVSAFGDPGSDPFVLHSQALHDQALAATGHGRLAAKLRSNIETSAAIPEPRLFELMAEAGFRRPLRFFQMYQIGGWIAFRD